MTTLHTVYTRARKAGLWTGANPAVEVERRRVPRKAHATLKAEEVPLLLAHVPADWRNVFAAAVYTGMRKGELFGLRRGDVDLDANLITIARSYDRTTTKGGHADVIPVATPLRPYLVAALDESLSELVFPAADGSMRSPEADPQKVLRHALARAGLVLGYEHVCRRCKGRGHAHGERHLDAVERRCPACGMRLWPKALPGRCASTISGTRPRRCCSARASRCTTSSASCATRTYGSRRRPTATWSRRTCGKRSSGSPRW